MLSKKTACDVKKNKRCPGQGITESVAEPKQSNQCFCSQNGLSRKYQKTVGKEHKTRLHLLQPKSELIYMDHTEAPGTCLIWSAVQ